MSIDVSQLRAGDTATVTFDGDYRITGVLRTGTSGSLLVGPLYVVMQTDDGPVAAEGVLSISDVKPVWLAQQLIRLEPKEEGVGEAHFYYRESVDGEPTWYHAGGCCPASVAAVGMDTMQRYLNSHTVKTAKLVTV